MLFSYKSYFVRPLVYRHHNISVIDVRHVFYVFLGIWKSMMWEC